jgi:hypothetical protein
MEARAQTIVGACAIPGGREGPEPPMILTWTEEIAP